MPYIADSSGGGYIDPRTLQLISLNRACDLHLKGLRSRFPLTKIGKRLGFNCRTVKALKLAVQQEIDFIKETQECNNE